MIWDANPVAFSVAEFDIRWYGLVYALGFFFCDWAGWQRIRGHGKMDKKHGKDLCWEYLLQE